MGCKMTGLTMIDGYWVDNALVPSATNSIRIWDTLQVIVHNVCSRILISKY